MKLYLINDYSQFKLIGKAILIHLATILTIIFLIILLNNNSINLIVKGVINWDAFWYQSIMEKGYILHFNRTSNLAFFPLFPAIWKLLGVNNITISIINYGIFLFSFGFLAYKLKIELPKVLFLLSTTSFIFFLLPYSEALFFLFGAMLLYGYMTEDMLVKNIGLFLISATRAVTTVFLPIIIVTELLDYKKSYRERFYNIACGFIFSLLGMFFACYTQYLYTGKYFYFLEVQKFWKRKLIIPHLPFTTYDEDMVIFLDAIALTIGIISIFFMIRATINYFSPKRLKTHTPSYVIFSLSYICLVALIDIIFTFYDYNGLTSIWSINRHVLCTPFFIIFFWYLMNEKNIYSLKIILAISFIVVFVTNVASYYLMYILYFYFFLQYFLLKNNEFTLRLFFSFYLLNVIIQAYYYVHFLKGGWVG